MSYFFFQAEDGIRDIGVTGVQTCALPILNLAVESPQYDNEEFGQVPLLETVATLNSDDGSLTIFAVNRAEEGPLPLEGDVRSFAGYEVVEHLVLEHEDPKATNTAKHPNSVM